VCNEIIKTLGPSKNKENPHFTTTVYLSETCFERLSDLLYIS